LGLRGGLPVFGFAFFDKYLGEPLLIFLSSSFFFCLFARFFPVMLAAPAKIPAGQIPHRRAQ